MELTKVTKKQLLWFVIAWVLYAVILLIPIADLEPAGHRALAALAWIVVILISNCIPVLLSTMIFAVMIILSGVLSQGALLTAFGTSPFWLCLALGVVALGMTRTNLGARIAYLIFRSLGKTPSLMVLAIMLTAFITSALIANLPALLAVCPIALSVLKELKEVPGESNLGKAMYIGLIWAGGAGGLCLPISAAVNAAAIGAIEQASEGAVTVSFVQFATVGIPVGLAMLISGWIFLSLWFRVNKTGKTLDREYVSTKLKELGPMDFAEIRYAIYLIAMILCFIFGGNFGLMPPTIAMLFMAIMMLPKIGLVTPQDVQKNTNWGMIIQIGFFVGFAGAISGTGLGPWMASHFFSWISSDNPLVLLFIVTMIGHVVNILVPGGGAAMVVIPSVWAISQANGINTALLMLMIYHVTQWSQILPVQPQYLVVQGATGGYIEAKDYALPNILVSLVWTVVLLPVFYLMAPMAGLL